jgi:hypothetical protein
MCRKGVFGLVGDDESGPEDLVNDEDLECGKVFRITLGFELTLPRAH